MSWLSESGVLNNLQNMQSGGLSGMELGTIEIEDLKIETMRDAT